jgi:hypothetical protein
MPSSAIAMVHGLRGDDTARDQWLTILAGIRGVQPHIAGAGTGYGELFDAIVALHRGQPDQALRLLRPEPEAADGWYGRVFRQWSLALRAEAAVLAASPSPGASASADADADADALIVTARHAAVHNPIATAIAVRAEALNTGDRSSLLQTVEQFTRAGCRYQAARTQVLAGGRERGIGVAALISMGAAPMIV